MEHQWGQLLVHRLVHQLELVSCSWLWGRALGGLLALIGAGVGAGACPGAGALVGASAGALGGAQVGAPIFIIHVLVVESRGATILPCSQIKAMSPKIWAWFSPFSVAFSKTCHVLYFRKLMSFHSSLRFKTGGSTQSRGKLIKPIKPL